MNRVMTRRELHLQHLIRGQLAGQPSVDPELVSPQAICSSSEQPPNAQCRRPGSILDPTQRRGRIGLGLHPHVSRDPFDMARQLAEREPRVATERIKDCEGDDARAEDHGYTRDDLAGRRAYDPINDHPGCDSRRNSHDDKNQPARGAVDWTQVALAHLPVDLDMEPS
jgi:hypothetical protein